MTLQEQYNRIKEGKGSKHIFLTEAKKQFSNMLTNPMGFDEASTILKQRGVITENYIDLQPINTIEASPKTEWENKFADFINESSQIYYLVKNKDTGKNEVRSGSKTTNKSITGTHRFKSKEEAEAKAKELNSKLVKEAKEENIKVDSKKVDKSVEETQDHNFDYKDQKNLDNHSGQAIRDGVYFEAKQNPDKDIEEIKKIVLKNLEKDRQYYMKNTAFGVEGLGYQETEVEEVSGKYKASGYSDKLKKLVKESLVKEDHTGNPNDKYVVRPCKNEQEPWAVWEGEVRVKGFATKEEAQAFADKKNKEQGLEESYDEFQRDDKGSKDVTAKDKGEEEAYGAGVKKGEKIEKKKMKKESLESKLAEIDKQGAIVALEAKIDMVGEAIEKKNNRISMVSEDENLSELVDKTKIKAMQKEVKLLEKQKAKMEKMYEKMCGKSYTKEEIVDETLEGNE